MTFAEARAELAEISGGRYRAMGYELTDHGDGTAKAKCWVYVDPGKRVDSETWRDALDGMAVLLGLKPEPQPDIAEAPDDEVTA